MNWPGFASLAGALIVASGSVSQEIMGGSALIAILGGIGAAIFTAKTGAERNALRGQVDLQKQAADAWKTERDAEVVKAERLAAELRSEAQARIAAEARTDIRKVESQIAANHADALVLFSGIKDILAQVESNTRKEHS